MHTWREVLSAVGLALSLAVSPSSWGATIVSTLSQGHLCSDEPCSPAHPCSAGNLWDHIVGQINNFGRPSV
jgi:hypothetical protein